MFSSFEWSVAARYLKARRNDRFISVIAGFGVAGITLGVMVLIVVMAVMNGFREELLDKVLGVNGHATVYGYQPGLSDYDRLTEEARAVEGVVRANPIIDGQVMATFNARASGAFLRGVTAEMLQTHELVAENILAGSLEEFGRVPTITEPATIAMGIQLAETLGVQVGDLVTLISPQGTATPFGTAPRMQAYQVIAVFEVGVFDYDKAFVFMPLEDAQLYFRMPDMVTGIEIFVEDPDSIGPVSNALNGLAEGRGFVRDWRDMNESLFTALVVERNVMFIILTLIILIAAFNIISSLIILVKDKAKDIAILKTMGAGRRSLMKIFMIAGASIGFAGTFLGSVLGILLALNIKPLQRFLNWAFGQDLWNAEIRFLTEMPAKINFSEVLLVVGISFLLSFLATLPPARRVAKLDPVEVLRNEG